MERGGGELTRDQERIAQAAAILRDARSVVALTGAGLGRPSGIPDFRSEGGLWSQDDPMEAVSLQSFRLNPQRFYDWIQPLLDLMLAAKPNPAHHALVALETMGKLRAVITQNIDGLHQRAGSRVVHELHGHVRSATCFFCGHASPIDPLIAQMRQRVVPRCHCGGPYKPDIVFFGEMLPEEPLILAQQALERCDVLMVLGTSLVVHPAAGLPLIALQNGAHLLMVNMSETYLDGYAAVVVREDLATAVPAIVAHVEQLAERETESRQGTEQE